VRPRQVEETGSRYEKISSCSSEGMDAIRLEVEAGMG
jgi:hypothetical protein